MTGKKENVLPGSKMVLLTPAQQQLINQCNTLDAYFLQNALLHCYILAVHYIEEDEVKDLYMANDVLNLRETILKISIEKQFTPPKGV